MSCYTNRATRALLVDDPTRSATWTDDAACIGLDAELFWPVGTGVPAQRQAAEAKAVCARCPVRHECLELAFAIRAEEGIFGGLDQEERRLAKRRRDRARTRAVAS